MSKSVAKTPAKTKVAKVVKEVTLAVIKDVDLTSGAKVFTVPLSALYVEKGFNIRELDAEHVKGFADSYKAKRHIPSLSVKHTEKGLKVIEGHHRFEGATAAKAKEVNVELFEGSEQDEVAYMITSSQGRTLEPLERAAAYQRMLDGGSTKAQINKLTGRSRTDIDRHLMLNNASTRIKASLKKGEVGFKAIVEELARNPIDGNKNLEAAVKESKKISKMVTTKMMQDKATALIVDEQDKPAAVGDKPAVVKDDKPAGIAGDKNLLGDAAKSKAKFTLDDGVKLAEILSGFEMDYLKQLNADIPALVLKYIEG